MAYTPMEPFVIILCAFFADGSFDCDEQWTLYLWDTKYPPACTGGRGILGCAFYVDIPWVNKVVSPQMHVGNSTYIDMFGMTILEHEIKHLRCLCNFHSEPIELPRR